jgi:hypothetical protein
MGDIGTSHSFQSRISVKEGRSHKIHPGIGALGRQAHGDHQFVIFFVVQCTGGITVALLHNMDNLIDLFCHGDAPFLFFYKYIMKVPYLQEKIRGEHSSPLINQSGMASSGISADNADIS